MADINDTTTSNPATAATGDSPVNGATADAKERFSRAIEEAKAGVHALGKDAQAKAGDYREKASVTSSEWLDEAKALGGQARERATVLATDGKAKASEAITGIGKMVEDNAATIDAKFGEKYGDYARKAATSIQDAGAKLDSKDLNQLGDEAMDFVKKSPGLALGIAAVAGYLLANAFRKGD